MRSFAIRGSAICCAISLSALACGSGSTGADEVGTSSTGERLAAGTCAVTFAETSQWTNGFVANVTITSGSPLNSWTLGWSFPGDQKITNSWSSVTTQSGQSVTATNAPYNGSVPANGSVSFGFSATFSNQVALPSHFVLNGVTCGGSTPPPVDAGSPPPVDAGTRPPVDAGSPPPVDAGSPPPVDSGTGTGGHVTAPNGYYVSGPNIYTASGTKHLFHGVDRPSLEWNAQGQYLSANDYQLMASWKANVVRIPLNQDFWLQNGGYASVVDQQVQWAHAAGLDVILDLHWSDKGVLGSGANQQNMADDNSVTFWKSVASRYKGDGRVLFELYNEPHDVSWSVWLNGGDAGGFHSPGMQGLYNAVRSTGAENLVLVGGLNWAYDLSGVPSNRVQGQNIAYVSHVYNFGGKQPGDWQNGWGFLTATDPVVLTEFGTYDCSTSYYSQLISYANSHNTSWTAWAWWVGGCGFPSIISDWNGTPNAPGQVVKSALQSY